MTGSLDVKAGQARARQMRRPTAGASSAKVEQQMSLGRDLAAAAAMDLDRGGS